jgi:hypothetical protein
MAVARPLQPRIVAPRAGQVAGSKQKVEAVL